MANDEMTLTFSIRNNPGVYALLLGSGVSTEAGVPTGWGVVEDLIRKLADIQDRDADPDPFEWYEDTYNKEPEYDELLEQVAPSKEERQSLLEKYFEPTPEEREEEIKTPTEAHENIAWLVDEGYINVIVTTNFDQLLEQALSERGITPVVISNPADAKGAVPLAHQQAVVLKVNGDYKETNIKNITEELEKYDTEIETLLEQIFDEYGLIVCGWSGDWDIALKNALLECESRRYSTFWAYHGDLEDSAEKLVAHRDGISIQINGASDFFRELKENVQALEGAEPGAPLTREVARERVKRYMTREPRKIDLADLLQGETEEVQNQIFDENRFPLHVDMTDDNLENRLSAYENTIGTLAVSTSTCAYWGPEVVNPAMKPLAKTVRRLGSTPRPDKRYKKPWRDLRQYPATFLVYGMGVAGVASENWELINQILVKTQVEMGQNPGQPAALALNPWKVGSRVGRRGAGDQLLRNRMKNGLRDPLRDFIPDESQYEDSFQKFEAIADLVLLDKVNEEPRGNVRHLDTTYWKSTLENLGEDLESAGEKWGPIQAGLFNASEERAETLIGELEGTIW